MKEQEARILNTQAFEYDVIVIGGGPGGYEAAIRCAQNHLKTVLVEMDKLGGTCLNRGCIPAKTLLHSAELYAQAKTLSTYGIHAEYVDFDYAAIAKRKDQVTAQLRNGIAFLEKSHGVEVVQGKGILKDPHTVCVGDKTMQAQTLILATGSKPAHPPIPGIDGENILDSDGVLALTKCPERVTIVGGGVIGLEFATLFSSLGKQVTILEALDGLLPALDADVASQFLKSLKRQNVSVHTSAMVRRLEGGKTVRCTFEKDGKQQTLESDICIVCTGRVPLTREIGLEECGVECDRRGFVAVNDCMQTSVPNIYAIGDITGKIQLAHVATAQGMVAAANAAKRVARMHYEVVPACIYTSPEIAYVGMNSEKAAQAGYSVKTGSFQLAGNGRALSMGQAQGIVKLITEESSGQILGAQILGPHATELIGELCVAAAQRLRTEELGDVIHPHPTVSECIMEAAHAAEGMCCNAAKMK